MTNKPYHHLDNGKFETLRDHLFEGNVKWSYSTFNKEKKLDMTGPDT